MNEVFDPTVESFRKSVAELGTQAKERFSAQVKRDPAKTLSVLLGGAILVSVLVGYGISRMEEESRRDRLMEDWVREVTNWIRRNGRKITDPIQDGLGASKSAVEDATSSTARRWLPFLEKQKRSFLNLF
jgi:hypothetical protein